ncbi:MAG: hypothetical protein WBW99_12830 [Pseudolabrys sp.]
MTTVDDLQQMAHELYARARTSIDPSTRRMLITAADNHLRQADEIRAVTRAEYPTEKKVG